MTARSREFPVGRPMLTLAELAARWNCSDVHLTNLIAAGNLAAIDVSGGAIRKHWRVPFESVSRFEAANGSLFDSNSGTLLPASPVSPKAAARVLKPRTRAKAARIGKKTPKRRQCAAVATPARGRKPQKRPLATKGRDTARKELLQ